MGLQRILVRQQFERESRLWKEIYETETVEAAVYGTRQEKILAMVGQLPLAAGARVLELGCGAGRNVAALARRGFRVHAVDLVPQMLADTRALSASQGTERLVSTWCADAEALPFASGTFDLVIGIALLEWTWSDRLFDEIARVMRPGGFVILTATNRWSLQRCLDPYLNPAIEPVKRVMRGGGVYSRTHSRAEIEAGIASAGLVRRMAITAGFGPFTFFKRKWLPGVRGARLHQALQCSADRPGAQLLNRAGYAHIVLAVKPEEQ